MSAATTELNQPVFLTTTTLRARYDGVSRMWISRRIKHDGFPAPIRLGTTSTRLWRLDLVKQWERDQAALGLTYEKKAVQS
jgi:predicted DNA-binding transcriptional regulator AlpA